VVVVKYNIVLTRSGCCPNSTKWVT